MTHDTDCRILEEFRAEVTETAAEFYEAPGDVGAFRADRDLDEEIIEDIAERFGWEVAGLGAARATFIVEPEGQEGPRDSPMREAPCVVKFATPGKGLYDGRKQNTDEVENFRTLPDELTGVPGHEADPDAPVPVFVPISDWDKMGHFWVSMPEVDPHGGNKHEAKDRISAAGWRCRDIHSGNVGTVHNHTVIVDYGLDCDPDPKSRIDPGDVADMLADVGAVEIEARSGQDEAVVEFYPPPRLTGMADPVSASVIKFVRHRGGLVADTMSFSFGLWDTDADDRDRIEQAAGRARNSIRSQWDVKGVDEWVRAIDRGRQIEVRFEVNPFENPGLDKHTAVRLYETVVDAVESHMPRPELADDVIDEAETDAPHPNLSGIRVGDVIDHPEFVNEIEVTDIDRDEGKIVVVDSNDNVHIFWADDFEVTEYDWSAYKVASAEIPADVTGIYPVSRMDPDDVDRILNVNNQIIRFDIPSNYSGEGTGQALAVVEQDVVYQAPNGEEYWTNPEVVADNATAVVQRLKPSDLAVGDVIDHPELDEPYGIVEIDGDGNIMAEPAGAESPQPDLRVNLRLNDYQPIAPDMIVGSESGATGRGASFALEAVDESFVRSTLSSRMAAIDFEIPQAERREIGRAYELDHHGEAIYKRVETYAAAPLIEGIGRVADNAIDIHVRLTPSNDNIGEGMVLTHPLVDGRLKVTVVEDDLIQAETLDGEKHDLSQDRYQPLVDDMISSRAGWARDETPPKERAGRQMGEIMPSEASEGGAVPTGEPDLIEVVQIQGEWEVLKNGETVDANNRDHEEALRRAHARWTPGEDILKVTTPDGREVEFRPDGNVEQQQQEFSELLHPPDAGSKIEVTEDLDGDWAVFEDAIRVETFRKWADAIHYAINIRDPDDDSLVIGMPGSESPVRMGPGDELDFGGARMEPV